MRILDELERLSKEAIDAPWGWRRFGDRWHLVADHGRRDILLSNARSRNSAGLLEDAHPNMTNMALLPAMRNNIDCLIELARSVKAYFEAPFCPETGDDSAMTEAEQKMLIALEKLKLREALKKLESIE